MNAASPVSTLWSEEGFARVADEVRARAGLMFPANRVAAAESGMRRAMATLGVSDAHRYATLVAEGGPVLDALVAELTIGETYFFRESQQLEFVRRHVMPELVARRGPAHPLRVWSAGCASGEEAYSLAIILHEEAWGGCSHVLGTDVSRPRLAAARRGEYTKWSLRGVSPDVVERYFARRGPRFVLSPQIRSGAQFRYLNLAEGGWPAHGNGTLGVDLILCRNVLMYLDPDVAAEILKRFVSALSEPGWLLLGASDPPLPETAGVDVIITGAGLAYKRTSRQPRALPPPAVSRLELPDPHRDVLGYTPSEKKPPPVEPLPELPPPLPAAHAEPEHVPEAIARAWKERDYPRVIELAEQDVETGSRDPAVWVVLVRALANQGRLEEAGHACVAALERHRASAELLHLHALLLLQGGQPAAAAMAARRALYLDRSMVVAHMVLGSALAVLGDGAGARRAFGNVLALVERLPPDAEVPGADGETVYRIVQLARAQLKAHAGESS